MYELSTDLEKLNGVGPTTAQKLMDNGFRSIEAIAAATVTQLTAISGISESQARELIETAAGESDGVMALRFKTGDELLKEYKNRDYLTSGCDTFDKILDGGFSTQKLYEFWGSEGTGKSNILHQLICTAALPKSKGGLGGGTIYIDAENALSLKRIKQIAPRFGLDPEAVIKNISRTTPANSDALKYMVTKQLGPQIEMTGARLIVLDSIASHFRSEYGSQRNRLPERQQKANQILHELKKCAKLYNVLAVITNQASGDPSGYGPGIKHSMGNVVGHESEVRIKISINSTAKSERKFLIEKAVDLAREKVILKLLGSGYYDSDAKEYVPDSSSKKSTSKKGSSSDEPKITTKSRSK
jgi:DNA repair protein RadA